MIKAYLTTLLLVILVFAQSASACNNKFLNSGSAWPGVHANLEQVQVHTSAESGFFKKIEIIKQANLNDELSLMYFIYDNDFTSSYISKELIAASKRGARVNLMVDYFMGQNIKATLQYLESFKNINVKLFRPPTAKFHHYLKTKLGIKTPTKFTLGLAKQNIDLVKESIMTSPKLAQKIQSLTITLEKSGGIDSTSYAFLMVVLSQLNEYQELPLYLEEYSQRLHHKWLALKKADSSSLSLIVGGRNISDEYHIGLDELSKKRRGLLRKRNYPFIDTEISAVTDNSPSISLFQQRYHHLWNLTPLTQRLLPLQRDTKLYKSIKNKMNYRISVLNRRLKELKMRAKNGYINIRENEVSSYYSENAPDLNGISNTKIKDINISWQNLIEQAKPNESPIKIVSAYFYLYPDLIKTLSSAMAKGVEVEIYTNSIQTTDLSMINIGAYKNLATWKETLPNSHLLKVFELQLPKGTGSLHSKIMKVGSYVAIGSANSDPRSFLLDTNNVLFFDLSKSGQDADAIFEKYLNNPQFSWSELTPELVQLTLEKLNKDQQAQKIMKALEIPFFQKQL